MTVKVKTSVGHYYLLSATPYVASGCCFFVSAVLVLSVHLNCMAFNGLIEISPKSEAEVGGLRPEGNQAASVVLVVGKKTCNSFWPSLSLTFYITNISVTICPLYKYFV